MCPHCSKTDSETVLPSDLNWFPNHLFPISYTLNMNYILIICRYGDSVGTFAFYWIGKKIGNS